MKIIKYIPKTTLARCEYRDITEEDQSWLITYLIRALCLLGSLDQPQTEDQRIVRDQWAHRRLKTLPRGRGGMNTPVSMIAGIIDNFMFQTPPQRDFTQHQCEALESISMVLHLLWPEVEAVRFQIAIIEP